MLTSTPYPSTEALIADAQLASVRALSDTLAGERGLWAIRNASAFEDLCTRIRDRHEDQVYSIIEVVVRAMESWAQLQDHLAEASGPAYASLRDDVQAIASSLVFDGFIAATPLERLLNLPRYIQAQSVRLRKALRSPADVSRDEKSRAALSQIDEEVEELRELMARPSGSRRMSTGTTSTGTARSRTMADTIASCWASLRPNTAQRGPIRCMRVRTTWRTPAK